MGEAVNPAGDINGDGIADFLVAATDDTNGNRGRSYAIFGANGIGSAGLISLSGLNGVNGFKLDGEMLKMIVAFIGRDWRYQWRWLQ